MHPSLLALLTFLRDIDENALRACHNLYRGELGDGGEVANPGLDEALFAWRDAGAPGAEAADPAWVPQSGATSVDSNTPGSGWVAVESMVRNQRDLLRAVRGYKVRTVRTVIITGEGEAVMRQLAWSLPPTGRQGETGYRIDIVQGPLMLLDEPLGEFEKTARPIPVEVPYATPPSPSDPSEG